MIADVLYNVNIRTYFFLCAKHFELSHVMDIVLQKWRVFFFCDLCIRKIDWQEGMEVASMYA